MACTANRCQQGRKPCPCPQACELPERCPTWGPGASSAPDHHRTRSNTTSLRALAAHAAAVALAVWALVFIAKTAAGA